MVNTAGLAGEFSLLAASGAVAIWMIRRYALASRFRGKGSALFEIGYGIAATIVYVLLIKLIVLPCLYHMRPSDTVDQRSFFDIASYSRASSGIVARAFFINTIYSPIVETFLFVGGVYAPLRERLALLPSLLIVTVTFSALHSQNPWFFQYLAFAVVNLLLFEMRKSLLAPATHHVLANLVVYGSQLLLRP